MLMKAGLTVSQALEYLKLTRSTYYYKSKKYSRRKDDEELIEQIKELKSEHLYWGYRRIWAMLKRKYSKLNQKRVYRIMKENGLLLRIEHKRACRTIQKKPQPEQP